jgi:hypothetical protein
MQKPSLQTVFKRMKRPVEGMDYYFIETIAQPDGKIVRSTYTHWVGFTDSSPMREIREGSIVHPERFITGWRKMLMPYVVVSTPPEMFIYFHVGGCALVEKTLAKEFFANVILPAECAPDVPLGFKSVIDLPRESFFHAPRPKLRMRVLKRDDYRCRICGRRPADYTDVELHVHHIRPWATGGLTEEQNLVTLCHSCHNGLSPHEERGLFELIGKGILVGDAYVRASLKGMLRYQRLKAEMSAITESGRKRMKR